MAVPVQVVHLGIGLMTSALAVPLVLRKVPMNYWYGVRTRKAFVSEENWFAVNAHGGKALLLFGLFLTAFALATWPVAPPPESPWAAVYVGGPLLGLVPVFWRIRRFGATLPDRTRADRGGGAAEP